MAQVTIYIPNDLESQIKAMAGSLNISISKFISTILEQKVQNEWSSGSRKLAGAWDDFPTLQEIRTNQGYDVQREEF
ncbi:MAG: CopG family transcriptional regulator [Epsilonproteobacteria bacterium]|nr:MAG: CopG family transcriptional regulator [Campylobacterota bacterium]